jgi:hypothetical protein
LQERDAERALECLDLLTDRLLSDVEIIGGAAKATPLGDRDEGSELTQLET